MHKDQVKFLTRLAIWGGVACIFLLLYFDANPITYESAVPEQEAADPISRTTGEVLIVVDNAAIGETASRGSFRAMDWSYAWINTVEQEFGPHTTLDAEKLRDADLSPYSCIVLTHSIAKGGGDPDLVTHLKTFVNAGGLLVIERPVGELRAAFAADGKGGRRQPKVITNIKDLGQPFDSHLKSMPLNTTYIGSSGPLAGATTWLAMDGVPVVYSKALARGNVVVVEFDFGLLMTSLQQGRPRDDFSVANRYPDTLSPTLATSDLVTDERMLNSAIPYADLFEKFLVHYVLGEARPVVGLWPFKDGTQGAVFVTHNDEGMGDDAKWMAIWEKERGVRSTFFMAPSDKLTSKGVREFRQLGADLQMQWVPGYSGLGAKDEKGILSFDPLVKTMSLSLQREALGTLKGDLNSVLINRNQNLFWRDNYTGIFRQLAAEGIKIDSSYGPDHGTRGYLFGTGLPFTPVDAATGLPLPLMEMPMLASENLGGVDMRFLHTLFLGSYEHYHEGINVLFRPNAYGLIPSVELFDLWLSTYDLAQDYQHWITSLSGFGRFWHQRREASVKTQVTMGRGEKGTLKGEDQTKPPQGYDPGPITLKIAISVSEGGHSASLPGSIRGRRLREVRRDLSEEPSFKKGEKVVLGLSNVIGRRVYLVSLSKGQNTLTAHYR